MAALDYANRAYAGWLSLETTGSIIYDIGENCAIKCQAFGVL